MCITTSSDRVNTYITLNVEEYYYYYYYYCRSVLGLISAVAIPTLSPAETQEDSMEGSPVPRPKSPPELYCKRRELAKVVMLEREIGFLQEELKSIETLQKASSCIKEVADYVVTTPEPLIAVRRKTRKSCAFWKWLLCGNSCFNMSCVCCNGCSFETPSSHCCSLPDDCCSCSLPKCTCGLIKPPSCPAAACFKPCSCSCSCCCPNCNSSCWPGCACRCKCCWPSRCSCWPSCGGGCRLENNCCYSCCCE